VLYGIISDVHASLPALEAVLRRLGDARVHRYLCLGDIVGYGASPNECCDMLRELDCVFVRGNHDEAAVVEGKEACFTPAARECIIWTREVLTTQNREFLAALEPTALVGDLALCHGSWPDPDYYTTTPRDALLTLAAMPTQVCLFGHTHYAEWYEAASTEEWPREVFVPDGGQCDIAPDHLYLLNPGSTGQPRDGNSCAAYALYDDESRRVFFERCAYNIKAAQDSIIAAGLPTKMASRLLLGI
jgi:predicted phosphodiesterase